MMDRKDLYRLYRNVWVSYRNYELRITNYEFSLDSQQFPDELPSVILARADGHAQLLG